MSELVALDACVLVPQRLSSLLLTFAEEGLFEPRWSEQILIETERALVQKLGIDKIKAERRMNAMRSAFPEAMVAGFEPLEDDLPCHPKDRHVLAATIAIGAETLVTTNLKDFPEDACAALDVAVVDPDTFLLHLLAENEVGCSQAVLREARRMRLPAMTGRDVLAGLTPLAPTFANTMHQILIGDGVPATDLPAFVTVSDEETPLAAWAANPDLSDPLHAALAWWFALRQRDVYRDVLHQLTYHPPAFKDYRWADELLDGLSVASKVYYAVDDLEDTVAFVRFVPGVEQPVQAIANMQIRGAAFATLRQTPNRTWQVWGLGNRMVPANPVKEG